MKSCIVSAFMSKLKHGGRLMKHYQRLGLEQLLKERTRLMEIKRTLMDQQKSRKQQLSKSGVEMEQMKSMADQLLEIILLNHEIQTITDCISNKRN